MIDLQNLTIKKAHEEMKSGKYSAVDLAKAYLEEIKNKNGEINAYLEVYDDVLAQAEEADKRFKAGTATLLTGIPFAIKDNILIKGKIASSASKILENYHATYDATVIEKLKKEEAVSYQDRMSFLRKMKMPKETKNTMWPSSTREDFNTSP